MSPSQAAFATAILMAPAIALSVTVLDEGRPTRRGSTAGASPRGGALGDGRASAPCKGRTPVRPLPHDGRKVR